jgi:hypothetical protein
VKNWSKGVPDKKKPPGRGAGEEASRTRLGDRGTASNGAVADKFSKPRANREVGKNAGFPGCNHEGGVRWRYMAQTVRVVGYFTPRDHAVSKMFLP